MSDLLRPTPPRSWRDRAGDAVAVVLHPAKLLTAAGAVLVVVAGAWWLLRSPAASVEDHLPRAAGGPRGSAPAPTTAPAGSIAPPESSGVLVVQAAGAVARPGVYRLTAGSRVTDLVAAAGGATQAANLDAVALAARLTDGQRVYVPAQGEAVPLPADSGGTAAQPAAPLDLNSATAEQLADLPGVGPTTAAAIVAHRERRGPFRSVESLVEVRGIGPAKLEQLRGLVQV